MIIYNYKYGFTPHEKEINNLIGKAPSFIQRIRQKRSGCSRMRVVKMSESLRQHFSLNDDTVFGSIELRQKGIVLYLFKNTICVAWLIPFHQLILYKTETWGIHASGNFIQFIDEKWRNKSFMDNLLKIKSESSRDYANFY